jgi:hypothetical protein
MPPPVPRTENLPFAFRGEAVEPARVVTAAAARQLELARNPTGKANTEALREFVGVDAQGRERRRRAVDFPAHFSVAEAALYAAPFAVLSRAGLPPTSAHRDDTLRNALARLERFLAAPADGSAPFAWIDGDVVPDDSLVVWARDDDFSAGVLASATFTAWLEESGDVLAALHSFPWPWPPSTPLSALSRAQEEVRFDLARAARAEDPAAIDAAVARAYGWTDDLAEAEIIARLRARPDSRR